MHSPTWDPAVEPFHHLEYHPGLETGEARLRIEDVPLSSFAHSSAPVEPIQWLDDEPEPTPEQVDLMFPAPHLDTDLARVNAFAALASEALPKAHRLWSVLFGKKFEQRRLEAKKGERYHTLLSAVGWSSRYLSGLDGVTPSHIYALWYRRVEHFDQDSDGAPVSECLWRFASDFFAYDFAQRRTKELAKVETTRAALNLIDGMVEGMRTWCEPIRQLQGEEARRYLRHHLLCSPGGHNYSYLLGANGNYERIELTPAQIVQVMRARGLHSADLLSLRDADGKWRTVSDIQNEGGTIVRGVRFQVGVEGSYIEHVDTSKATLVFGCYRLRRDLKPAYDADVDEWLKHFAGDEDSYRILCQYIGHALAFEHGALPMLSISGSPDVGKKMLAVGLSECLDEPYLADGDALFGLYQDDLLRSPFVWVDENLPPHNGRGKHPADRMREVIGAPSIKINRRYTALAELRTNVRIMITANNREVLARFAQGRDLDEDSAQAVAQRVIHINVPASCARWLAEKGNMEFTSAPGRRWIQPQDTNLSSDFVVARHFLWLHRQLGYGSATAPRTKSRFLMAGRMESSILTEMRVQSGNSPWVLNTLLMMLNLIKEVKQHEAQARKLPGMDKIAFFPTISGDVRMFVLSSGLIEYAMQDEAANKQQIPSPRAAANALKLLKKEILTADFNANDFRHCEDGRILLRSRDKLGWQRWAMIDMRLLQQIAQQWSIPCPLLDRLLDGAEVVQFGRPPELGPQAGTAPLVVA